MSMFYSHFKSYVGSSYLDLIRLLYLFVRVFISFLCVGFFTFWCYFGFARIDFAFSIGELLRFCARVGFFGFVLPAMRWVVVYFFS